MTIGRSDRAFALAERHRDFRTLTELCNEPTVGGSNSRIQYYLQKYRQAFAFELYQWYIEQGTRRAKLFPAAIESFI